MGPRFLREFLPIPSSSLLHTVFTAKPQAVFVSDVEETPMRSPMNMRGPRTTRWSPMALVAVGALVVVVLYLAPLQGLLLVGIWLICPLLMIGMHASGRHHGPSH